MSDERTFRMDVAVHTTRHLTDEERDTLVDIVDAVLVARTPVIAPSKVSILYRSLADDLEGGER